MTKIEYNGMTFSDENDQIISGEIYDAVSLISDVIEVGTFKAEVRVSDDTEGQKLRSFKRNDQLLCFQNNRQLGVWYVDNVERTSKYTYEISANNAVALLDGSKHYGGIYTGQTAGELIADICTIPHYVKPSMASQKLYGWLPVASRRSNLAQVLFAIGAYAWVDEVGLLRICHLWDGVSNYIGEDSIKSGDKVKYSSKITEVSALEHTYAQGEEEVTLFDGTAASGDIITFNEPAHSLTASGVTILESGANYVKISAGTGTVTGKKYIHTTRDVRMPVSESDVENVKEVKAATLVSLTNSTAVAQRLAAYYKCCETVQHDSIFHNQTPGAVISFDHPFDGDVVGCIKSSGIEIGAQKIVSEEKIISGFLPPQPSNLEYYDARVVLTGEGDWDPPEGVENVRYVMFSGAQGGKAGLAGGTSGGSKLHTYSHTSSITGEVTSQGRVTLWGGPGGKGGLGGPGGKGSKILQGTLAVNHGQPIHFNCGIGGHGAEYNVEAAVEGEEGGATTFGALTTDDGAYPAETGWLDVVTGDIFASAGLDGLPGGDGAGAPDDYTIPDNSSNLNEILKYKPATGAVDEDGVEWPGGPTKEKDGQENVVYWQTYDTFSHNGAWAGYALGPGGAAGVTLEESTVRGTNNYAKAFAANGLPGATPTLTPKKAALTIGGRGGYGGGGGSCASWAGAEKNPKESSVTLGTTEGAPGVGGNGGPGGPGGDGCILLFYRIPKEVKSGAVMDKTGRFVLDRTGRLMVV